MPTPYISVIVPTYNRSALLRSCIASFDTQTDAPPYEVVVVDDGSTDDTVAVLAELQTSRTWLVASSLTVNSGPAAARNAAIALATGDLLLFVDDDIVATPRLLHHHVDLHRTAGDPDLAILGRVDWHPSISITPFMRWLDRSGLQFAYDTWLVEGRVPIPASAFYTANLSMARRLVTDAGGFDERFPFPAYEDLELAARLTERGLHMDYRPAALAYHRRAIDLATFVRRMDNVGESAELMRAISPNFPIDDRALVAHRVGPVAMARTAANALVVRSDEGWSEYYWARIARAYDRGRGRAKSSSLSATSDRAAT